MARILHVFWIEKFREGGERVGEREERKAQEQRVTEFIFQVDVPLFAKQQATEKLLSQTEAKSD